MRALVFDRPRHMAVAEVADPDPRPGEVCLRVLAVGICGSDLHGYLGETGRRSPGMIMGHEIGAVSERSGAVVTVHPVLFCGECRFCRAGSTHLCADRQVIGVTPTLQGGFADYICVPERNSIELPGVTPEQAALVEPLAVGLHAVRTSGLEAGDRVLVTGAGAIGLMCALVAVHEGAEQVFVSEPSAHRRDVAAALGATVLDPADADVVEEVHEAVAGGVERAIDAVGVSATVETAIRATTDAGTVVIVGMGAPRIDLDLYSLVVSERRILGTFCYSEQDFLEAARWVTSGQVEVATLIERRAAFEEMAQLFDRLATGEDDAVKALLVTNSVQPAPASMANR